MNLHPREHERERLDREMEAADREIQWARFAPKGDGLVMWRSPKPRPSDEYDDEPEIPEVWS